MSDDSEDLSDSLATVFSGGVLVFGGKVVALGFGFLTQLVMARLLSTSAYGSVILTIAVVSILQTFSKVGLNEGMVRKIPEFEDSPSELRGVIKAGLVLSGGVSLVASLLLFILAPLVATRLFENPDLTPMLRIGALAIPLGVIMTVSTAIARGGRSAKPHTYVNQIVRPTGRLVFIGGLVALGFKATGAVAGHVLSYVAALGVALWFLYPLIPKSVEYTKPMYRTMLAFSLPLTLVHGMNFLMSNVDTFLIGYYLTSSEIGIYNIAFQLRNLLNVIIVTLGFLVPPMLAKLETEGREEELRDVYQVVTKWVLYLTFPMFVSFLFLPDLWIGFLFGSKYMSGKTALFILSVGVFFSSSAGLSGSSLVALGNNRIVMYTAAVSVVINIAFNILLVPQYGIEGAAMASTLSVIVLETLNIGYLNHAHSIYPVKPTHLVPVIFTGTIAAVILIYWESSFSHFGIFTGWVLLYAGTIVTILSEQDRKLAEQIFHDR